MKCLQIDRRRSVIHLAAALAGLGLGTPWLAHAEGYPAKPIQLIVPFPPGGAVDIVGRTISKKLGDRLGQPIVIENKAGAGTVVGAAFVANAPADGYTLLISSGSTFTAGSLGTAPPGPCAAERTWSAAGIKVMHVPYRGSAPAMSDLMGGQIPFTIDTVAAALPQLKAGKIKAIAVTGATRATQLPDVPTVAESGFLGFSADSWLAVVAPRGLPAEAKAKLHRALADPLADAEVRSKLIAAGLEPSYATGDAVLTQIEDELPRMRAIAQRAQIRAD